MFPRDAEDDEAGRKVGRGWRVRRSLSGDVGYLLRKKYLCIPI